jgi:hypothetical protein
MARALESVDLGRPHWGRIGLIVFDGLVWAVIVWLVRMVWR